MNAPKGEETIFAEALRLPPEERAAYLAQATADNPELRQRVESLLGSYQAGDFLEQAAAPQLRQTPRTTVPLTEKPGDTIGRYKLLQQIGEGGCGIVYMAEQAEPVRRRVALKIIKLGMDTKSVIARFEAERQALAMMDHPNIAKVFDAGSTERPLTPSLSPGGGEGARRAGEGEAGYPRPSAGSPLPSDGRGVRGEGAGGEGLSAGRPYFVMELVRGMKITEYCDEAKLSTRARLDLFIQVCQAIQHAHQKGIIHRDIKPSNILVTMNDGMPVPKVIDFGIAKATGGQKLTNKTLFTAFEQFIGTPAYMSPEQAVLTSLDIDTRSDIYALGVLLYELLTGKTPFDAQELLAIGLDEMRRTILEQEPPRPSTRLRTLPGQELSTTAQRRGLDAPKLVSELRGDLDWIVMKALEKDRARRYETANGLAADIQRYLANEPVMARPPSAVYRFQKLIRRNKLAFGATTAVAIALVLGVIASTWQAQRAKAERDSSEAVLKFFREKILAAGRPEGQEGGLGKDVTLRRAIDAAEPQITANFKNRPLVEAAIRDTLGASYWYLGEPALAIRQLERALVLRRKDLGLEHEHTLRTMNYLANAYRNAEKFDQALPLYQETLKLRKARLGPQHPDTLRSMNNLALVYRDTGKHSEALHLLEETFKLTRARQGPQDSDTLRSMNNLAVAYEDAGKFDQSLLLYEQSLEVLKAKLGPGHLGTLLSMSNLAESYGEGGKWEQALLLYEETFKLRKAKLGPDHPDTLYSMNNLAVAYRQAGKLDLALPLHEETIKLAKARLGTNHPSAFRFMKAAAPAYRLAGRLDELETLYREQLTQQSGDVLAVKIELGRLLLEAAETSKIVPHRAQELAREGEQLLRGFLVDARSRYTNDPLRLAGRCQEVAELRHRQGKYAEAEALYRETIQLRRSRLDLDHVAVLEANAGLAHLFSDSAWSERTKNIVAADVRRLTSSRSEPSTSTLRKTEQSLVTSASTTPCERAREAERLLREVLAVQQRNATNLWRTGDVKCRLGAALVSLAVTDPELDAGRREAKLSEAESLLLEGHEQLAKSLVDEKYKRDALVRLVRLYETWNKPDKRAEWQQQLATFDKAQEKSSASESLTEGTSETKAETK